MKRQGVFPVLLAGAFSAACVARHGGPSHDPGTFAGCWEITVRDTATTFVHPIDGTRQEIGISRTLLLVGERTAREHVDMDGQPLRAYRVVELGREGGDSAASPYWSASDDAEHLSIYWSAPRHGSVYWYSLEHRGDTLAGSLVEVGVHIGLVLDTAVRGRRLESCAGTRGSSAGTPRSGG